MVEGVRDRLWLLRLYYFAGFAVLGIYVPAFPRWLEARGLDGSSLGVIAASLPVMGLLSPPLFGALADATRLRGGLLLVTNFGATIAMAGLALFALTKRATFWAVIACVAAFAFFRAPMVSLADLMALESRANAGYGRLRLWGSLGFLVAALCSATFIDPTAGAALPVAMGAALAVAMMVAALLPVRASSKDAPHASALAAPTRERMALAMSRHPWLYALFACALAWQLSHSAYDLCYSLRLRDLGIGGHTVGVLWALGVLAEVLLMAQSEAITLRIGTGALLCVGTAAASARWLLIAQASSALALGPIQAMHALSFAASWIALVGTVRDTADPKSLGLLQGLFAASVALGSGLGMLVWSNVYRCYGGAATFRMAAGAGALATGFAVAFAWARRESATGR